MRKSPTNTTEILFNQDKSVLSFDGTATPNVPKSPGLNQAPANPHASFPGADYSYEAWIFYDASDPKSPLNGKVRFLVLDNNNGALVKEVLLWIPKASIIAVDITPDQQSNGKKIKVIMTANRSIPRGSPPPPWCVRPCTLPSP